MIQNSSWAIFLGKYYYANVLAFRTTEWIRATLNFFLRKLDEICHFNLLRSRICISSHKFGHLIYFHFTFVLFPDKVFGVGKRQYCRESFDIELFNEGFLSLFYFAEVEAFEILFGQRFVYRWSALLFREEKNFVLSCSISFNERLVILFIYITDKALHFLGCGIHNRIACHLATKDITIILKVLVEDQNLVRWVYTVLLTNLFLPKTVDRSNLDHTVKLLCDADVLVFKILTLLLLRIEEVNDPNFLPSIEFRHVTQI